MRSSNELRRSSRLASAGRYVAGLLLALAAFQVAHAGTDLVPANPAYQRFRTEISGNTAMLFYGSGGKLLPDSTPAVFRADGSALVRSGQIATKYGPVPFKVSQAFTLSNLAKGVATVATNPLLGVGLAIASPFIYDWLTDSGMKIEGDQLQAVDPATAPPPGYDGKEYKSATISLPWAKSKLLACSAIASYYQASAPSGYSYRCIETGYWDYRYHGHVQNRSSPTGNWYTFGWFELSSRTDPSPPVPTYIPADYSVALTKLEANSRTVAEIEKIISESAKLDALPTSDLAKPSAAPLDSTPMESPVQRKTETTTKPDGTTETTTRDCKAVGKLVVGSPEKITLAESCTTTVTTTPPAGSPTTTVSTSEDDGGAPATDETDFCASLLGKLVCADMDTPEEAVPERSVSVSYNPLNLFGSGTCPAPRQYTSVITGDTHTASFQPICDALALLRPMFLAIAAFIAYMILLPKGTQ